MTDPVDLTNLRDMTDGDKVLEASLFQEFYRAGDASIAQLEAALTHEDNEAWRKAAHAFKGVSLNLGANRLGELCKQGQDCFETAADVKRALLDEVRKAYGDVKDYLAKA